MGSNMAENHPIAFRFVMQAKERGATVIHVDPRFTRTSALADIYAPIRAGSDIAFLGGLIRLHPRARPLVQGVRPRLHQHRDHHRRAVPGRRASWTGCSRAGTRTSRELRATTPGSTRASRCRRRWPSTTSHTTEQQQRPANKRTGRGAAAQRPDAAAPELRLPDPEAALRRATRPRWSSGSRGCPKETFLKVAEAMTRNSGPRAHRRLAATRSAGRTTPPACR